MSSQPPASPTRPRTARGRTSRQALQREKWSISGGNSGGSCVAPVSSAFLPSTRAFPFLHPNTFRSAVTSSSTLWAASASSALSAGWYSLPAMKAAWRASDAKPRASWASVPHTLPTPRRRHPQPHKSAAEMLGGIDKGRRLGRLR